jgi:fructose-1,6-bisphosphatase II
MASPVATETPVEQLLALEMVRVTEAAAIASARFMGRGDHMEADRAATEAMRRTMDEIDMWGTIVIGEGERDKAPMLYIGEQVGRRDESDRRAAQEIDIAVDPLEGTNLVAHGQTNAITVLAASERGGLLHAPDTYMEKLCVGPVAAGRVDIRLSPSENLARIASALGRGINDITVIILERPRHEQLIAEVREAGARIKLISDGDLSAAISCAVSGTGVHAVMGIGGAPEGVITAAALRCLGGEIQARFRFRNDAERERASRMGAADEDHVYTTEELASGENLVFAATGVTEGDLLNGVRFFGGGARTHSLVMGYRSKQVRFVDTVHMFDRNRPPSVRL